MESTSKLKYVRQSPYKIRFVADLIRGKDVTDAINILSSTNKKASEFLLKLLNSAVSNINYNNEDINPILSYSLAIGSNLGDKTNWFFEAYQSQSIGDENSIVNIPISIDCCIAYLSANNVQLDLSMGLTFQILDT